MVIRNQKMVVVVSDPADVEGPLVVLARMEKLGPMLVGVGTDRVGVMPRLDVSESPFEGLVGACRT
jgi:hypothetical protein